jgi:internalin A
MAASERKSRTGGHEDDRKKSPEEIAEERIEEARKSKATKLDLSNLGLTELPTSIGQLTELRELYVFDNQLTSFPETIGQLTQLQILWGFCNQLTSLPHGLRMLKNLERLLMHNNSGLGLPLEILGPSIKEVVNTNAKPANPASILDYYFKMRDGLRPLNEVKLLLVGRGAAGKTSIIRRLIENSFRPNEKETMGIDIRPWELRGGGETVRANVWDFAGQVVTHATHQFFLSHRSVYVLVLTGREDTENQDAEYWLRLIRAFGTEPGTARMSPTIVALNKWDLAKCKVDRNALQEKYPFIVGFVETDCRSGQGITGLKKLIRETVDGMESVRKAFPQAWFAIKESLAAMKADYVSYGRFRELCRKLGEADAGAQDSLARVLHRLGVALNYADDERLREATVLNPHWVTKGIYTLLREAASDHGIMTWADVDRVLPMEKPKMRRYLVELMRRFDLAFPLTEAGDEWLVPQRLPSAQPKLDSEWQQLGLTRLRYTYPALPEGLIPRFITRTYPLSEGQERWMNGVVLVMDDAQALVRADPSERCVTATVRGSADGRRRLAGLVREDLRLIHAEISGLAPLEEMELDGKPSEWVRVQTLEADERKRQPSAVATIEGTVIVDNTSELNRVSAPAARDPSQRKAKLLISYSSRDSRQHDELTVRLKPMQSEGLVESWSARCLVAGEDWDKSIRRELEEADVMLVLLSPEFLASGYLQEVELSFALGRHLKGEIEVVPVILRQCSWEATPLGQLKGLPTNGRPLASWANRDEAWNNIAKALTKIVALRSNRISSPAMARRPLAGVKSQASTAIDLQALGPKTHSRKGRNLSKGSPVENKSDSTAEDGRSRDKVETDKKGGLPKKAISVAVSYSHKDEKLRKDFDSQLSPLKRMGLFSAWHDWMITPGADWKAAINDNFNGADLILLLVSSDFIASDYCYDVEMKAALERHENGEARVVPIILRACLWEGTPFGHLQALPRLGKPITSWNNRDLAWTDVVKGISEVVEELQT